MDYQKKLLKLRMNESEDFFKESEFNEHITEQPLGELFLPTGKIVANDPVLNFERDPFKMTVEPGRYPVIAYVHHIDEDKRVAFAEIRFTEEDPASFELALTDDQDPSSLNENEFFGYGVDSGTGGFMDKSTADKVEDFVQDSEDDYFTGLDSALDESYVDTYETANVTLPGTDLNIVAFSSGWGDGLYPSFWGYDKNGKPCCLITDFETIDDPDDAGDD